jgi:hypothetical protein
MVPPESPQLRFAQAAGSLRHLDAGLEVEPLFFTPDQANGPQKRHRAHRGQTLRGGLKFTRPGSGIAF